MNTIKLTQDEISAGLAFTNQIRIAQAVLETANQSEAQFIAYLRKIYNVPDGYTLRDWIKGFVPEVSDGQHDH